MSVNPECDDTYGINQKMGVPDFRNTSAPQVATRPPPSSAGTPPNADNLNVNNTHPGSVLLAGRLDKKRVFFANRQMLRCQTKNSPVKLLHKIIWVFLMKQI